MITYLSLRTRLMLAYAGLLVIGFMGLALLAGREISAGTIADYEHRLVNQTLLISRSIGKSVEEVREGDLPEAQLDAAIREYVNKSSLTLTLLHPDGRFWLTTTSQSTFLNYDQYPEITAARNYNVTHDTRTNSQGISTIFAAAPILHDDTIEAIIQLSAPLAEVRPLIMQRWLALSAGVLLLALLALGASVWLAESLTRPLTQLRNSALQLAGGDLSQRLTLTRQDEFGQLAHAFNYMADQVQAMIEEQRTFASNASHELRTPLTTIRLRSEALRDGLLDETTARQYIADIDDEVERLGHLVQDLILLSRADAGRLELGQEEIDPVRLARHLYQEVWPQAVEHQQHLVLDLPDTLPPIAASLSHVHVVFRNVLSNALKYTPANGQITWRLWAEAGYLRASICDNGQGIAAEDLPHVFMRFYRTDKAHTRQVSGIGLGLSLVQMILQAYHGRILIHSPGLGQGTAVDLWWPLSTDPGIP